MDYTTLFAVGSSTASATSTLFSVSNTGNTTIGNANGSAVSLNIVAAITNTATLNLVNGSNAGMSFNASGNNVQIFGPVGTFLSATGNMGNVALTGRTFAGGAGGSIGITAGASSGGTDLAGSNVTVSAGAATGNAAGGSILFNTSIVGSTGSTVQTLAERLRISNTGNIGVASTSPFASLSIHANNGGTNTTLFAIGSSTASATTTLFSVDNLGRVSAPVSGTGFIVCDNSGYQTTGTSMFLGNSTTASVGSSLAGLGRTGVLVPGSGGGYYFSSSNNAYNSVDSGLVRIAANTLGASAGSGVANINGTFAAERLGLGTTTPYAQLSIVATSTNGVGAPTTLFAIASTTGGTATSTLLSFSNAGQLSVTNTNDNNFRAISLAGASSGLTGIISSTQFRTMGLALGYNFSDSMGIAVGDTVFNNAGAGLSQNNVVFAGNAATGIRWTSSTLQNLYDTGISRAGAGVVRIGNGSANAFGTLTAERIGLGTTTPYAQLSIVATSTNGLGAPTTLFAIASTTGGTATSTLFSIGNTGTITTALGTGLVKSTAGTFSLAVAGTDYLAAGAGSATTTLSFSGPFSTNATPVVFGSSPITATYYGLATTTALSSSQLLVSDGGAGVYGVATSSATLGLGLSGTLTTFGASDTLSIATSSLFTGTTGQVGYFSGTNQMEGTSSLNISTAGRIGIGTTSPTRILHVNGSVENSILAEFQSFVANDGNYFDVAFRINTSTIGDRNRTALRTYLSGNGGSLGLLTASSAGTLTERVRINSAGNVGIGTTSPYARLSIHANNGDTNTTLFAIGSSTASATSTLFAVNNIGQVLLSDGSNTSPSLSFASETGLGFYRRTTNIIGVGRSTAPTAEFVTSGTINGINLGNGIELSWNSTGLGSGSADTYLGRIEAGVLGLGANGIQGSITGTFAAERIGLGTTTPYAQLSIVATSTNGIGAPTTLFAIASTTAGTATSTLLSFTNTGNLSINPSSGIAALTISSLGTTRLNIAPETTNRIAIDATSGIDMRIAGRTFDFEYNGDVINGQSGAFLFDQSANSAELTASTQQQSMMRIGGEFLQTGTAAADGLLVAPIFTSLGDGSAASGNNIFRAANGSDTKFLVNTNGLTGISTSSPFALLSIHAASTTGSLAPTVLFAIGSSSQGTATSTHLVVTNTGNVGIGSTTPSAKLSVVGTNTGNEVVTFINEGTGSGDEVLHLGVGAASADTSNLFIAFYQGSSVAGMGTRIGYIQGSGANSVTYNTTSDRRLKDNIASTTLGLETLMNIGVHDFNFKNDPTHTTQGFIAQELYEVYPFAVARTDDGTGSLKKDEVPWGVDYGRITPLIVQAIQDIVNLSTPFKTNLIAWFADASNGIEEFFANRIKTTELCVKDEAGETCLTRAQLNELLAGVSESVPDEEEGGGSEEPPAEEPPAEEIPTEEPPAEGVPAEEPPAEEAPEEVIPEESNAGEEAPPEEVASDTTI